MKNLKNILKEKTEWRKLATFVPNKKEPIYNWFYYKEGFSKELIFKIIEMFGAKKGQVVFDPFCGSGTTLLACKQKGINSIGIDVMPVCILASAVKTRDYNIHSLLDFHKNLFSKKFKKTETAFPNYIKRFFNKHTLEDIAFFTEEISKAEDGIVRDFFLLSLINTAMKCSYAWKDGGVLKIKKHPIPPFSKIFRRISKRMIKEAEKSKFIPCKAIVKIGDARRTGIERESVDFVITSPPYLNNIDYTKVYSIENFFVSRFAGKPEPSIRSYIGMLPKDTPLHSLTNMHLNIPPDAAAYFSDMLEVLKELYRVCRKNAKLAVVIGNAYYPGYEMHIESDIIISELAEKIGFKVMEIFVLNKRFALEKRTIKKGVIRESMVLMEK